MYLISYDITKDKVRRKVAKELENYGRRVQFSVFECDITKAQYAKLYGKLLKLMKKEEEGNIRFYSLCANCLAKTEVIGNKSAAMLQEEENLIVI